MQQFVKLVNEGKKPVSLPYRDAANREEIVTLEPGVPKIVPQDVLFLFCGDHSIRNTERWRIRDEAYDNLAIRYGAMKLEGLVADHMPKIKAYDENDQEIPTLLSDPDGVALTPEASDTSDVGIIQKQIEMLTAEVNRLQRNAAAAPETPDTDDETVTVDEIPADAPKRPKVSR